MTDSPITIENLATLAIIAGVVVTILSTLTKIGVEYLSAKFGPAKHRDADRQAQSEQCRFDHNNLNSILVQQNANIASMLKQNGEQIKAISDEAHANQLRHQIVLARLDRLGDGLEHLKNR